MLFAQFNKGLVSKTQLNNTNNPTEKWIKDFNRTPKTWMANKHMTKILNTIIDQENAN